MRATRQSRGYLPASAGGAAANRQGGLGRGGVGGVAAHFRAAIWELPIAEQRGGQYPQHRCQSGDPGSDRKS
jgi:hypothetical protein